MLVVGGHPLVAQVQGQLVSAGAIESACEYDAQVLLNNGNALAAGGLGNSYNVLRTAEVYNSSTGQLDTQPLHVRGPGAFSAVLLTNGKVLISGGLGVGSKLLAGAEFYDSASGN